MFENIAAPFNWSNKSSILNNGYIFLMMTLFNFLPMQNLRVPSLQKKKVVAPHSDTLGLMYPLSSISFNYNFNSNNYGVLILYGAFYASATPDTNLMVKSTYLWGEKSVIYDRNTS